MDLFQMLASIHDSVNKELNDIRALRYTANPYDKAASLSEHCEALNNAAKDMLSCLDNIVKVRLETFEKQTLKVNLLKSKIAELFELCGIDSLEMNAHAVEETKATQPSTPILKPSLVIQATPELVKAQHLRQLVREIKATPVKFKAKSEKQETPRFEDFIHSEKRFWKPISTTEKHVKFRIPSDQEESFSRGKSSKCLTFNLQPDQSEKNMKTPERLTGDNKYRYFCNPNQDHSKKYIAYSEHFEQENTLVHLNPENYGTPKMPIFSKVCQDTTAQLVNTPQPTKLMFDMDETTALLGECMLLSSQKSPPTPVLDIGQQAVLLTEMGKTPSPPRFLNK